MSESTNNNIKNTRSRTVVINVAIDNTVPESVGKNVKKSVYARMQEYATDNGFNVQDVIRLAISEFLNRKDY